MWRARSNCPRRPRSHRNCAQRMRFLDGARKPPANFVPSLQVERNSAVTRIHLEALNLGTFIDAAMPLDNTVGFRVDAGLAYVRWRFLQIESAGLTRFADLFHAAPV